MDQNMNFAREMNNPLKRYLAQGEKRNPWIFRGYYHPAWFKRDLNEHTATSNKMDEVTKLLNYKMNQLANHSTQEETKRSTHQRALTVQEEKDLENLAGDGHGVAENRCQVA
ncbi:hypothetical protein E3U43_017196 [Larimichthys crocea]|uniref:Uncharacterized protein n=1 Tax=Larimichthys crocea TaxID=215358 RepID=A0ACD3QYK0_LARCR|nr:hypothetical protein E3U43_017196 [Larimichthys crocea]